MRRWLREQPTGHSPLSPGSMSTTPKWSMVAKPTREAIQRKRKAHRGREGPRRAVSRGVIIREAAGTIGRRKSDTERRFGHGAVCARSVSVTVTCVRNHAGDPTRPRSTHVLARAAFVRGGGTMAAWAVVAAAKGKNVGGRFCRAAPSTCCPWGRRNFWRG
jgi:hypothetical protein